MIEALYPVFQVVSLVGVGLLTVHAIYSFWQACKSKKDYESAIQKAEKFLEKLKEEINKAGE